MVDEFTSNEFEHAVSLRAADWRRDTRNYFVVSLVVGTALMALILFGAPIQLPVFGLVLFVFGLVYFNSHRFRMIFSGGSPWDRLINDWHNLRSSCQKNFLCDVGDSLESVFLWGTKRSRFLLVGLPVTPLKENLWQGTSGYLVAHYCDLRKQKIKKPHWIFLRHIYVGEEPDLVGYFHQLNSEIEESLLSHTNSQYIENAPDPAGYEPLSSLVYRPGIKVEVIEL